MRTGLALIVATILGFVVGGFVLHPGSVGDIGDWDSAAIIAGGIFGFATTLEMLDGD